MRNVMLALLCVSSLFAASAHAGTPTQYYVDPGAGNDSTGDGSITTPWKTTQHALNTITRDATNGDQINIKAGTDDVLTAPLAFTTYGSPTQQAPIILRGYTSTAKDGGIGSISGNALYPISTDTSTSFVCWMDLHLHNVGNNPALDAGYYAHLQNCEIDGSTYASNFIDLDRSCTIQNCYVHDFAGTGIKLYIGAAANWNYIDVDDGNGLVGIGAGTYASITRNIIYAGDSQTGVIGIESNAADVRVINNTIYANGAVGTGIKEWGGYRATYSGNIIEGFSGVDSYGFQGTINDPTEDFQLFAKNAFYNCTNAYAFGDEVLIEEDNEILASSPLAKTGELTYANRMTYFSPVDVGNVWGGAYPAGANLDKGAVQHVATASSGGRSYILSGSLDGELRFTSSTVEP